MNEVRYLNCKIYIILKNSQNFKKKLNVKNIFLDKIFFLKPEELEFCCEVPSFQNWNHDTCCPDDDTVLLHGICRPIIQFKLCRQTENFSQLFQFTCLPNGFSEAQRKFTDLLKAPFTHLRARGHIDDSCLENFKHTLWRCLTP